MLSLHVFCTHTQVLESLQAWKDECGDTEQVVFSLYSQHMSCFDCRETFRNLVLSASDMEQSLLTVPTCVWQTLLVTSDPVKC